MKKNTKKKGGKAIASGGFGCVFSPALKCIDSDSRPKNYITKLMTIRHTMTEMEEIKQIEAIVKDIPNYKNYYLLYGISTCKPDKLTHDDLVNFKEKCTALPKDSITLETINNSLNKTLALNMPNGGIPVDDYIYQNLNQSDNYTIFKKLNNSLIELLQNGILYLNKKDIYHNDIKDSNILVDTSSGFKTRLIDWGLSSKYISFKDNQLPNSWLNRPLQYNVPFSIILFTDLFINEFIQFKRNNNEINAINLKPFLMNYIKKWMNERGKGHYDYINEIFYTLFSIDIKIKNEHIHYITDQYIINYLITIILKYNSPNLNESLNFRDYLDNVFIKIVDIWGFISTYYPFLELIHAQPTDTFLFYNDLYYHLKQLFLKYLYNPRVEPINISELVKDLEKINIYFDKYKIDKMRLNKNHTKKSYVKKYNPKRYKRK